MLYVDVSHTCHTRARTGIQRVVRSLHAALREGNNASPITWDPYACHWRKLAAWEHAILVDPKPAKQRLARWPWPARLRGHWSRWRGVTPSLPPAAGLVVPELFSPAVARVFHRLHPSGPKVAVFHDAIALKLPELTPAKTVARYPTYLQELLEFDGIAAVSEDSRQALLDYWRWLEVPQSPPVVTIPLGLDPVPSLPPNPTAREHPTVLCVGTIEGRKNHLSLLAACERLWQQQERFTLRLIGLAHPTTGRAALDQIRALQTAGRPLRYDGPVDDATLEAAYAECTFTVYPSQAEGFGLPVLESLARGKPCICSRQGALGEASQAGGCLNVGSPTPDQLADALGRLLRNPRDLTALASAARGRSFRSWQDYVGDLLAWLKSLA